MPNTKEIYACLDKDGKSIDCTEDNMCPGWKNKATWIGFYTDKSKFDCRVCQPNKEAWISVDFGDYKGICWCVEKPINLVRDHIDSIVSLLCFVAFYYACRFVRNSFIKAPRSKR